MKNMALKGIKKAKNFAKAGKYDRMFDVLINEYHVVVVKEVYPCDMIYKLIESSIIEDDKKKTVGILSNYEKFLKELMNEN